ncbi:MAG: hypothetical protein R3245_08335 [Kiloniellales bacterium]|nr:hypothetical protein [Kiloniellales bacterium]
MYFVDPEPKRRQLVSFATSFAIQGPLYSPEVVVDPASATDSAFGGIIISLLNALGSLYDHGA